MRGKAFRKKAIAATAALVLMAAVVLLGAMLIERLDQRRQEQELAAERETLRTSGWATSESRNQVFSFPVSPYARVTNLTLFSSLKSSP